MNRHPIRRLLGVTATLFTALMLLLLSPGVASAATINNPPMFRATEVSIIQNDVCTGNFQAYVCFQKYGDNFFVVDQHEDSSSAVAYFETGYGRTGACYNPYGQGHAGVCNLDLAEGARVCMYAGIVDRNGSNIVIIALDTKKCFTNDH
ncbi:hypothetical protein AB0P21_30000 [Kribbella sp. NPDC056861]|uniref:hypothetical protein n=1 Tax=Kribbella sp. NPDC056861 TaxID=3154857 RepID=UPI00342A6609